MVLRPQCISRSSFVRVLCAVSLLGIVQFPYAQMAAQGVGQEAIRTLQKEGIGAKITALTTPYEITRASLGGDQSRIVFYRPIGSGTNKVAANDASSVFVEKMYHASLIPGGYSSLCFRPGATELGLRQVKVGTPPKDGQESILIADLVAGQTLYVRVGDGNPRRWNIEQVSAETANAELPNTRLEAQTISRVIGAQECRFSQTIKLAGDTLFKFDKSNIPGLTGAGVSALDQLAKKIQGDYSAISAINVTGYADPLGNVAHNEKLSRERAKTVLTYLQNKGISADSMNFEGRGARDLVVSDCGKVANSKSIACNQPNRRVIVDIIGKASAPSAMTAPSSAPVITPVN